MHCNDSGKRPLKSWAASVNNVIWEKLGLLWLSEMCPRKVLSSTKTHLIKKYRNIRYNGSFSYTINNANIDMTCVFS